MYLSYLSPIDPSRELREQGRELGEPAGAGLARDVLQVPAGGAFNVAIPEIA